ncbi:MAG: hypothetical protein B7Y35_02910 [Sphingomonadales bacterium 28-64-96]|nr:MAG: hypothetical protein B7Y35_02910 [Sphingomonadales bacterium 28-64-96]
MGKLTFKGVEAIKEAGRYADGDCLHLLVSKTGAKSWVLRVQKDGKRRDIGLGGYPTISIADARAAAAEKRTSIAKGSDPIAEKRARKARQKQLEGVPTFERAATLRHDEIKATFRNEKHRAQWLATLKTYAVPTLGSLRIDEITRANVRDALLPIWLEKPETARRVRQRIEDVLTWAIINEHRPDIPELNAKALGLPKQPQKVEHFAAMPWKDVPAFAARLQAGDDGSEQTRLALELLILTVGRSGEIRGMTWGEVDLEAALWTVPAERMKAKREHAVPLTSRAVEILKNRLACRVAASDLVFPGRNLRKPMSDMTLQMAVRRMGLDYDPHGFRSSFRDWVADATSFPGDLAEAALAHIKGNATERAYARSTMLEKRRQLMDAWGAFVGGGPAGNVVPLRSAG